MAVEKKSVWETKKDGGDLEYELSAVGETATTRLSKPR